MSEKQLDKIRVALSRGYRMKHGRRHTLSYTMHKLYETTIKAAKATRGVVVWPAHYGPARRVGNDYISEQEYRQKFSAQI